MNWKKTKDCDIIRNIVHIQGTSYIQHQRCAAMSITYTAHAR